MDTANAKSLASCSWLDGVQKLQKSDKTALHKKGLLYHITEQTNNLCKNQDIIQKTFEEKKNQADQKIEQALKIDEKRVEWQRNFNKRIEFLWGEYQKVAKLQVNLVDVEKKTFYSTIKQPFDDLFQELQQLKDPKVFGADNIDYLLTLYRQNYAIEKNIYHKFLQLLEIDPEFVTEEPKKQIESKQEESHKKQSGRNRKFNSLKKIGDKIKKVPKKKTLSAPEVSVDTAEKDLQPEKKEGFPTIVQKEFKKVYKEKKQGHYGK